VYRTSFDLEDHQKELVDLKEPLLSPLEDEREGYVLMLFILAVLLFTIIVLFAITFRLFIYLLCLVDLIDLLDALKVVIILRYTIYK
jgi:hypothetical protein